MEFIQMVAFLVSFAVGYKWYTYASSFNSDECEFNFLSSVMAGLTSFMILFSIIDQVAK